MKYVIMTEGTCEKALIDVLIKKNLFSISVESLLYEQIFHARQIKTRLIEMVNQLPIDEKITIIRIGDKLSDELFIPEELEFRVEQNLKVCIRPEFEILHLIYRGEDTNYIKHFKTKKKPSEYLLEMDCAYEKTYEYNYNFFDKLSNDELKHMMKKYSNTRKKVHKKDECILEDFIKKED